MEDYTEMAFSRPYGWMRTSMHMNRELLHAELGWEDAFHAEQRWQIDSHEYALEGFEGDEEKAKALAEDHGIDIDGEESDILKQKEEVPSHNEGIKCLDKIKHEFPMWRWVKREPPVLLTPPKITEEEFQRRFPLE